MVKGERNIESPFCRNENPLVAPSPIADPTSPITPNELTLVEIKEIIDSFGDAALRAKKAGYDAVEIHGAHGYLIQEFTSQYSNKRTDEYGGDLSGRAKFSLDIIRNIRSKVGEDYPLIGINSDNQCRKI